jgi:hypothetical protein
MTALVTNAEVQALVLDGEIDMGAFINTADTIVSELLLGAGLSTNRLKQIELYLAGHFYVVSIEKGGMTKQNIGEAEERYRIIPDTETGLAQTRFGAQALALDSSGILAEQFSGKTIKALFTVI